jgi:hypothetical protein
VLLTIRISKKMTSTTVFTVENSSRKRIAKALGVKGPVSGYFYYLNSRRSAFKEENSDLAPKDVVSGIAAEWRELSENERATYLSQATEDTARYNTELDAAIEAHGSGPLPEVASRSRRERKQKRLTVGKVYGVKGAKTAYILFGKHIRAKIVSKNPDADQREILRLISIEWKKITPSQKKRFVKKAQADRARYNTELQAAIEADPEKLNTIPGRKVRTGPTRARTAYLYFCQEARSTVKEECADLDVRQQTAELGRRWKQLDEEGRKPFVKLAEKDRARYQREKVAEAQKTTGENTVITNEDREEVARSVASKSTKTTKTTKTVKVKKFTARRKGSRARTTAQSSA